MRGAVLVVWSLVGCDPLASSDYVGQPMFTLVGTFASTARAPADPVGGLALMWQDTTGPGGPGVTATVVPVAIEFPTTFRVDVPTPPPAAARFGFADTDATLAEAYVFVVADTSPARLEPRGSDRVHVLVYATADVVLGTLAADYLGGPVTAGYHLRRFAAVTTPSIAQATLIERCVATGPRAACEVRRGYQLGPIADDDPLRIAVMAP